MKQLVSFAEVLLRLSPPGFQRFSQACQFDIEFGGAELNVATSLAHFGLPSKFISRVPDNAIGDRALMELRKHCVDTSQMLKGGKRLGIYYFYKCFLVPLDWHHARHITRRGRCLPGGHHCGEQNGFDRIHGYEYSQNPLAIR